MSNVVKPLEIAAYLAATHAINRTVAESVVSSLFDLIRAELAEGKEVLIPGFGRFKTDFREARTGRNPRTGEALTIAATTVVKFRPMAALKAEVKG